MSSFSPRQRILSALVLAGSLASIATPAAAWWRGGVWIGVPPVVVTPPAYYPPYYPYYYPPYYAPPPYYPPAATPIPKAQNQSGVSGPVAYGTTCYAGVYSCQAPAKSPVGGGCTCPGLGAPSYGVVN
ncbi:MAG TPA: hypothetical protein VMB71_03200 [Acetobacteraceae bacterium]|nr:hypothetical protein [Acetobacteraceae bacterium]